MKLKINFLAFFFLISALFNLTFCQFPVSYKSYINEVYNLGFLVPDGLRIKPNEKLAKDYHIEFDSLENVVSAEYFSFQSNPPHNNPTHSLIGVYASINERNMGMKCTIFPKHRFNKSQIVGLTAFSNSISREETKVFEFSDITVFCPSKLYQPVTWKSYPFDIYSADGFEIYSMYVLSNDFLLHLTLKQFPKNISKEKIKHIDFYPQRNRLNTYRKFTDFRDILNSFEINGERLFFSFDNQDSLVNLSITNGKLTKPASREELEVRLLQGLQKMLKTLRPAKLHSTLKKLFFGVPKDENLDSLFLHVEQHKRIELINTLKMELFDFPSLITPSLNKELSKHLKTYYSPEHSIAFKYRGDLIDDTPIEGVISDTFYLKENGSISGYSTPDFSFMSLNHDSTEENIQLKTYNYKFLSETFYTIDFTAFKISELSDNHLKAMTYFFNSFSEPVKTNISAIDDLTIFVSNELMNERAFGIYYFYSPITNTIFIRKGDWIYRLFIWGYCASHIEQFLNSIEVNGIGLDFKYESNKLVRIEKKASTQNNLNQD